MANFGNPMDYFQAGRAGGAARSNVSAVGQAIRGILQQGQKRGLIEAQAGSNLISSMGAAQYKQGLENKANAAVTQTPLYNARGELITNIPHRAGQKPIVQKPVGAEEQYFQQLLEADFPNRNSARPLDSFSNSGAAAQENISSFYNPPAPAAAPAAVAPANAASGGMSPQESAILGELLTEIKNLKL